MIEKRTKAIDVYRKMQCTKCNIARVIDLKKKKAGNCKYSSWIYICQLQYWMRIDFDRNQRQLCLYRPLWCWKSTSVRNGKKRWVKYTESNVKKNTKKNKLIELKCGSCLFIPTYKVTIHLMIAIDIADCNRSTIFRLSTISYCTQATRRTLTHFAS